MTIKSHTDANGHTTITVTISPPPGHLGPAATETMSLGAWSRLIANPITIVDDKAA